jgi:hypothetical protein
MVLLDARLRAHLPPLRSQEAEADPVVYARFWLSGQSWYVLEGQPEGEDFVFFGFVTGVDEFCEFRLSELAAARSPGGSHVELDPAFTEGRLTEVVPAPDS